VIRSVGLIASIALAAAAVVTAAFGDTTGDSPSRVDLAETVETSQSGQGFTAAEGPCASLPPNAVKVTEVQRNTTLIPGSLQYEAGWEFIPPQPCVRADHFEVSFDVTRQNGRHTEKSITVGGLARNAKITLPALAGVQDRSVKVVVVAFVTNTGRAEKARDF
jgi:hypothetical protein